MKVSLLASHISNLTSQNGLLIAVDDDVSYKEQS